jgi:lysophospholipase L1-like esterase
LGTAFPRPTALRTAALAVVSTVLALGFGEALTRVLGLAPLVGRIELDDAASPLQVSENPVQAFELKASFSLPNYRTNSHGLRGPERTIPKPSGVFRIALVGDSVVEGMGLGQEDTIASQLDRVLEGRNIEVVNAGVRGYNTQAEVELLRLRVLSYEPDVTIVVFTRNDHQSLNRYVGDSWSYRRPRWSEVLFSRSHLFRFAAFSLNWFHFRQDLDPDYLEERIGKAQARDNVAAGMDELARLSLAHRFRTIVVVWPNFSKTINDPPGLLERNSDRMRVETLAARHEIPVVRLSEAFTRDYVQRGGDQPPPRTLYTFDGMHPTPEGAKVAATILGRLMQERGLLNR